MATHVRTRLQSIPYFTRMSSKSIKSISECVKLVSNSHTRLFSTTPQSTFISDRLKAKPFQLRVSSQYENASKVYYDIRVGTKLSLENVMVSSTRSLSSISPKDASKDAMESKTVNYLEQSNDGCEETVEEHEKTIYKGILSTQIKLVKSFSLLTSAIGLSCQPLLLMKITGATGNLALAGVGGTFLAFFTFATPLLIHYISKKYVTELVYNKIEDSYTAITYSLLLREKKVNFKISDVKIPDIPGMFTTIIVGREKQIPLFVDGAHAFSDPQHYVKIMGYDKPLNLRWNKEADASQSVVESRRRKTERQKVARRSGSKQS